MWPLPSIQLSHPYLQLTHASVCVCVLAFLLSSSLTSVWKALIWTCQAWLRETKPGFSLELANRNSMFHCLVTLYYTLLLYSTKTDWPTPLITSIERIVLVGWKCPEGQLIRQQDSPVQMFCSQTRCQSSDDNLSRPWKTLGLQYASLFMSGSCSYGRVVSDSLCPQMKVASCIKPPSEHTNTPRTAAQCVSSARSDHPSPSIHCSLILRCRCSWTHKCCFVIIDTVLHLKTWETQFDSVYSFKGDKMMLFQFFFPSVSYRVFLCM